MASIIMHGENNPTLARDVMFSTLMIVLNGMVGLALVIGALRYWEQEYNLEGARAFLVVIASLAVFGLIIPNYTKSIPDPSKSPFQAGLFAAITILFYVVFVIIQTARHRAFFAEPVNGIRRSARMSRGAWRGDGIAFVPCGDAAALARAGRAALRISRHPGRSRHRAAAIAGGARRHHDRRPGAVAGGTDRLPRRARQSSPARGECLPRLGAGDDRTHHPCRAHGRAPYRARRASRARSAA